MTYSCSALFMGRKNDPYSESALDIIRGQTSDVTVCWSEDLNAPLPDDILAWHGDLIICFRSYYLLRKPLLEAAKVAAINFHPGSSEFRGSDCAIRALYEDSPHYGSTAHLMTEKVDSGTILDVQRFPITAEDTLPNMLKKTYEVMVEQAGRILPDIIKHGPSAVSRLIEDAEEESWSGPVGRLTDIAKIQRIDINTSKEDLDKTYRATSIRQFGPRITLHGQEYYLKKTDE